MIKKEAIEILRSVWAAPGGAVISKDYLDKIAEDALPGETELYTVMRVAGIPHIYEMALEHQFDSRWMSNLCAVLEIDIAKKE